VRELRLLLGKRMMGAGVGLLLDRSLGEPPLAVHPVALFGKAMTRVEMFLWRGTKPSGISYGIVGIAFATIVSRLFPSPFVGTALATYLAVAEKSLLENAAEVRSSLERGDLKAVRVQLPSLVGRDPESLDSFGAARAVVESVAENSSDAVIAPMVFGALFGGTGAAIYRAINTMDAMVAYRSPQYREFGWFCARLDDLANCIPSRLAALLAWSIPNGTWPAFSSINGDASRHPSPNAGVVEATYAHKLGVKLGGENVYEGKIELRPEMGGARAASASDIGSASDLCRRSDSLFAAFLIVGGATLTLGSKGN
jgi:adenosylcobinamide-phosphate synthase